MKSTIKIGFLLGKWLPLQDGKKNPNLGSS